MTPDETIKLCRMVKALCPSQQLDQYTPDAWAIVLSPYRYEDARQAVADIASADLELGKARYIEPGHIIAQVKKLRARRLDVHPAVEPPLGLDSAQYLAWQRETNRRIADGETLAGRPASIDAGRRDRAVSELVAALPDSAITQARTDTQEKP